MKQFISFGSIKQFNEVARDVNHMAKYNGLDEKDKPIYKNIENPKLIAIGSEKIHGTNFTIAYNEIDGIWYQSRNDIITPEKDNAGSAFFAEANKETFISIIKSLAKEYTIDLKQNTIVVCGEWAGMGIQKKAAVEGLSKRYFLFQHFKVAPIDEEARIKGTYWEETKIQGQWIDNTEKSIYNIMNFPIYEMEIDFENPKLYINKMVDLMQEIEKNSPVGQTFGIQNNIGEGVVFTIKYKGVVLKWKVKGEEHSKTKVKQLKAVDNEKEQIKIDIANKVTPAWRLEQMYDLSNDIINGGVPTIEKISDFLKMVIKDILKEEMSLLVENGLEIKDISSKVSKIARIWYLEQLQNL